MPRAFEQLAASKYRDRRARLARLREAVEQILGPHWQVHVKPGRRRIHRVWRERKPPDPALELLAAAVLWESRKNGDSFRKLQYSRAHSQWKCPWGILMQVRKALSAPRVTEVHFQTDEDNDFFSGCMQFVAETARIFTLHQSVSQRPFTVSRYTRPVFWHR